MCQGISEVSVWLGGTGASQCQESHRGSGQSCAAPVRAVGTCSTQGITAGLGGRKGITRVLQCPSVPRASCARQEHLSTSWGPCNLFLAMFPCQSLVGGAAWGLCGSSGPAKGIPSRGWNSRAAEMVTLESPKSLYQQLCRARGSFATKAAAKPGLALWHWHQLLPVPPQSPCHLLPPKCGFVTSQDVSLPALMIWLRLGAVMPHTSVASSQRPFPSRISDLHFSWRISGR